MKDKENDFVETYLKDVFGKYTSFIKEWLAIYCYTNYKKLPTLVFKGKRGTGKNTFAEMVMSIFPALSGIVKDLDGDFNPNSVNKLVIIDENDSKKSISYTTLKKYSGQEYIEVNKKYQPQYQVRNNMNIIVLSNDMIPIVAERTEKPTDSKNNQFFVYEFKKFGGSIDPDLQKKLRNRLGHYIRTELKTVYESHKPNGYRYSIDVPITMEEEALFDNNTTEIQDLVADFLSQLNDCLNGEYQYLYDQEILRLRHIPYSYIKSFTEKMKITTNRMIKEMKRQGYIAENDQGQRLQAYNKRMIMFQMTPKMRIELGLK